MAVNDDARNGRTDPEAENSRASLVSGKRKVLKEATMATKTIVIAFNESSERSAPRESETDSRIEGESKTNLENQGTS